MIKTIYLSALAAIGILGAIVHAQEKLRLSSENEALNPKIHSDHPDNLGLFETDRKGEALNPEIANPDTDKADKKEERASTNNK